jgi:UDP-glucose 4-epimerase
MKKILVTGGAGYIGSACVKALIEEGNKVTVFDDFSTGQKDKISAGSEVIEGSLCNLSDLSEVCRLGDFDAVMHFAAKKAVAESEDNPSFYFANNVLGSFNLLRVMEEFKIPQIIFSSTAAVYAPIVEPKKITESSLVAPISVYGVTKLMVEDMIKSYVRTGKISQFSILRYFNVAGDGGVNFQENNPQNVFPILANKLKNEDVFEIFGDNYDTKDGTCVRDYIHLKDLVSGHLLALHSERNRVYNLGTGTGYSVKELVEAFNRVSGKIMKVKISPRRSGDAPLVIADASLANHELGWYPKQTLDDMVKDTLRVFG